MIVVEGRVVAATLSLGLGLCVAAIFLACGRERPASSDLDWDNVQRTSTRGWVNKTFPVEGIQVDVPVNVCREGHNLSHSVNVELHAVEGDPLVFRDRRCVLKMHLSRVDRAALLRDRDSARDLRGPTASQWQWQAEMHPEISILEHNGRMFYRLDAPCSDTEILWMSAEFPRNTGRPELDIADDGTIKRLFESARCVSRSAP